MSQGGRMGGVPGKLLCGILSVIHHLLYDITIAYHRKSVLKSHQRMGGLGVGAVGLSHKQKHHGGMIVGKQNFPH